MQQIPLDRITPNRGNPRGDWQAQTVERLVPSIRRFGLLQPLVVRPLAGDDGPRYELVVGERRFRAAQLAELTEVPCIVRPMREQDVLPAMMVENLSRKALSLMEVARALHSLCGGRVQGSHNGPGMSAARAARLFGKHRQWAAEMLSFMRLPEEWQARIDAGELTFGKARELARHADSPELLARVARDIAENPWAWRTAADFGRSLKLQIASLTAEGGRVKPYQARPPRSPRIVVQPAIAEPPAAANSSPEVQPSDVAGVCLAVAQLGNVELDRVEAAIARRRRELNGRLETVVSELAPTGV